VRDADAALGVDDNSDLVLHAGKRHGYAVLTDQERLARQLVDDALQRRLVRDGAPATGCRRTGLADRQRARSIAAYLGKDRQRVARICAEAASYGLQLSCLGQQIGSPRREHARRRAARRQRHQDRQREGAAGAQPLGLVDEGWAVGVGLDHADAPRFIKDGEVSHAGAPR
jgi:hypothetical protein